MKCSILVVTGLFVLFLLTGCTNGTGEAAKVVQESDIEIKAIEPGSVEATAPQTTCTDSDVTQEYPNGINPYTQGNTSQQNVRSASLHQDNCINDNMLNEYYCQQNNLATTEINCLAGCTNGKCNYDYNLSLTISTLNEEYELQETVDLIGFAGNSLELKKQFQKNFINKIEKASFQENESPNEVLNLFDKQSISNRKNYVLKSGSPVKKSGFIEVIHQDNFEDNLSETQYFLHENNSRYMVYFETEPRLVSGTKIEIIGKTFEQEIVATDYKILEQTPTSPNIGQQNVAVLLVNFQDNQSEPITTAQAFQMIFNDSNTDSVTSHVIETSYNKTWLEGDVFGWYTLPTASSECPSHLLAIEAADSEVYFPDYSRILIIFPSTASCPYSGVGTVGQIPINTDDGTIIASFSKINGTNITRGVVNHELGHNFGVWHANFYDCDYPIIDENCISLEYGDLFDVMGNPTFKGHFNAEHKETIGWIEQGEILEVIESGVYTIHPIELSGSEIKALKVRRRDNQYYYIEYRRPIGYDSIITGTYGAAIYDGAILHLSRFLESGDTQLLDYTPDTGHQDVILKIGETYNDFENHLRFSVLEASENFLRINIDVPICGDGNISIVEDCETGDVGQATCNTAGFVGGQLSCTDQCDFDTSNCFGPICAEGHIYMGNNTCETILSSHPEDGYVLFNGSIPWNQARTQNQGTLLNTTSSYLQMFNEASANSSTLYRISIPVNTSVLPDTSQIQSASIKIKKGTSFFTNQPESNDFLTVVPTTLENPPFLSLQDFSHFSSINNPVELSNRIDLSQDFNNGSFFIFPLNSQGLENINTQGYSTFGLRTGFDIVSVPPNAEHTILFFSLNSSNTESFDKPKLKVIYRNFPDTFCGDGILNETEQCDGQEFDNKSCIDFGFFSGNLNCTNQCTIDTSNCQQPICGEDIFDGNYSCTSELVVDGLDAFIDVFSPNSTQTTWNELRHASSSIFNPNPTDLYNVLRNKSALGSFSNIHRIYYPTNTSHLQNSVIINSVNLILKKANNLFGNPAYSNSHTESNDFIVLVPVTPSNPPNLINDDFDQFSSIDNPAELSERLDLSNWYQSIPPNENEPELIIELNNNGLDRINKNGYTFLGLRGGYDLFSEIPNNGQDSNILIGFKSANTNLQQDRPKLKINYNVPPREPSIIKNYESFEIVGLLNLKVQKKVGVEWLDVENGLIFDGEVSVPANGSTSLADIWNPIGWTPTEAGEYRAFAEFQLLGQTWTDSSEFLVEEGA